MRYWIHKRRLMLCNAVWPPVSCPEHLRTNRA